MGSHYRDRPTVSMRTLQDGLKLTRTYKGPEISVNFTEQVTSWKANIHHDRSLGGSSINLF